VGCEEMVRPDQRYTLRGGATIKCGMKRALSAGR